MTIEPQKNIQQAEKNLLSIEGIEMRVNRSSQVEGAFGVIKQDFQYERFRRRSINKVSAEFMLVCLGYNVRKLFKHFNGEAKIQLLESTG
ncbi:MAG: transposase [Clostridium sp.]|nr:MAG: transposase [Clostridium sp.]